MQAARTGALYVGTPEEVAEKIVLTHAAMGHDRHILQLDFSSVPQAQVLESIELLGTQVLPLVNDALGVHQLEDAVSRTESVRGGS